MKTGKIFLIAALAILVLAGVYFGYGAMKKQAEPEDQNLPNQQVTENNTQDDQGLISGKITDLLSLGKSLKCTYTIEEDVNKPGGEGTIMVSGNKMRGDSTIMISGDTGPGIDSHFISMDNTMYTWASNSPTGIKITIDEKIMSGEDTTGEVPAEAQALQEKMDYKCLPWIADQSVFELPADVEFTDVSELTKNLQAPGDSGNMCAVCNLMETEEQKAECLTNFNCE